MFKLFFIFIIITFGIEFSTSDLLINPEQSKYEIQNSSENLTCNTNEHQLKNLEIAISPYLNKKFELVVTLGSLCLTKYRISSFPHIKRNFEVSNHLFDWMIILNYTAFGMAVENEFNDVFGIDYLNVTNESWLKNEKYNFLFNHVFGFEEVSHKGKNRLTHELFHKYYYLVEAKMNALVNNSKNAIMNSKKTLYVVYAGTSTFTGFSADGKTQSDFINLMNSIKLKRDDNFMILVLVTEKMAARFFYEFDVVIENSIVFHLIKEFDVHNWSSEESVSQWNKVLNIFLNC